MAWIVDTCLVIDVLEDDPQFGERSAAFLDEMSVAGLALSPVSYIELAPAFLGDDSRQRDFLDKVGIQYKDNWTWADTLNAHRIWHAHILARREAGGPKRPVADMLIGAFALRFEGLLTRNIEDFTKSIPGLRVRSPA